MKKYCVLIIVLLGTLKSSGQISGSITVGGDFDKFYPVTAYDGGWVNNATAELELGRSEIHLNSSARGGVIARFKYHTNAWGNGANFIDADVIQVNNKFGENIDFIAGWQDASGGNATNNIVIWLRGGGTTYYFRSLFNATLTIYDGVANPLPFQEQGGPAHTYKTAPDPYVNSNGLSKSNSAFFNGNSLNYFAGDVSIGIRDSKGYKLAVAGNMIAESVKVKLQGTWPDYVFAKDYELPSLEETEKSIQQNGHLPEIPSAAEVKDKGINIGEMNAILLKKIEELTLYVIDLKKENEARKKEIELVKAKATHSY